MTLRSKPELPSVLLGRLPYTPEEDALILERRKTGTAFFRIGLELRRSENSVRNRWRKLETDAAWANVGSGDMRAL